MPDTGTPPKRNSRTNLDFYHSPTQLRFDTWNRLKEHASRLREKHMRKADVAALTCARPMSPRSAKRSRQR